MYIFQWFRYMPIVVSLLLMVSGYSIAQDVPSDDSILTQQACTFPCWYGLIPGQTTLEMARAVLPTIPFVFQSNGGIREGYGLATDPQYYMSWRRGKNGGSLAFENGILRSIVIDPNLHYTLQDILTRYGSPDAWTSQQQSCGDISCSYLESDLYYLDYGLIVQFEMYFGLPTTDFYIRPEAEGLRFLLVPNSSSITDMLMDQWGISLEAATAEANQDFQYTWPGLYAKITLPSSFFLSGFHDVATIVPPSAATLTAIPSVSLTPTFFPTATAMLTNTPP